MLDTQTRSTSDRFARQELHTGWRFRRDGAPDNEALPAAVPGCVHTDLLAAGRIPDPFVGLHENDVRWVAETDWRYATTFDLDAPVRPGETIELVCDGLDTSATVYLNGARIAQVCSMHTRHRLDIADRVTERGNTLEIVFESSMGLMRRLAKEHGELPHEGAGSNEPMAHNAVRKMSCAYGWDWGPVLPAAGIWRPIAIERWSTARLGDVRPLITAADQTSATIEIHADVTGHPGTDARLVFELLSPDGKPVTTAVTIAPIGPGPARITVPQPELWWPAGHGQQPLYTLTTRLLLGEAETRSVTQRIGLRTVELIDEPDPAHDPEGQRLGLGLESGRTMHLRINGKRIFCKGANWIPDDPFPSRITPAQYHDRVVQARQANMNMLRVWGGGIYEDKAFYDACDELGIMVWQDFLCACAAYHEHEPYRTWFEEEARDNVSRLAPHPSLVLWCGNNECLEATPHWGPFQMLRDDPTIPWGLHYYFELFPKVISELDPTRPYWPGSPYTPGAVDRPREENSGDAHIWDVWNGAGDAKRYLMHAPRFASEFGFHGPPTWPTLRHAIPADQRAYDSPAMVHHNKHAGGQPLANKRMSDYFAPPEDFDDWLYLAQVVQARSLAMGCEWFRALSPWCSGALYWQFNDLWPVSSWAAVDGQGRPKPLWFATKRFFRPRLLTIRPANPMTDENSFGALAVYLHNDHDAPWTTPLVVEERDLTGAVIGEVLRQEVTVAPGDCLRIPLPEHATGHAGLLLASAGPDRAHWFPKPDHTLRYPVPKLNFELKRTGESHEIHIRAESLVRDLCIFPDRIHNDATISDQLITLMPGEEATVWIHSPRPIELRELIHAPVLQTVNRFGLNRPPDVVPQTPSTLPTQ